MFRQKKRIYKGFYITAAAWLLYFFSTGASSYGRVSSLRASYWERGWDQSIIGLSSSMLYLAVTVSSVLVSMAEKAKGIRTVIMTGAVLGMAGICNRL